MRWILAIIAIAVLSLLILIGSIFSARPLIDTKHTLLYDDVSRIKEILRQNNPRKLKEGEQREILLNQRDLNLILNYAARRFADMQIRPQLQQDFMQLQASISFPLSTFVNIQGNLRFQNKSPQLTSLQIGWLQLPESWMPAISQWLHRHLGAEIPSYQHLWQALEQFQITPQHVKVSYRWSASLLQDLKLEGNRLFFDQADRQRLAVYQKQIAQLSHQTTGRWASLHNMLQPLFKVAQSRSLGGEDAVAENRALLYAMALYILDNKFKHLLTDDMRQQVPAKRLSLLLHRRQDLSQHFILSAAVSVSAGSGLADAVGLFKEIHDSQDGSGFSFADLLADRAGIRFAVLATESRRSARRVQDIMSKSRRESDYMPNINDLPEGIMELEFKARYEDLDSQSYQLVENEIQRRISTCKLHSSH